MRHELLLLILLLLSSALYVWVWISLSLFFVCVCVLLEVVSFSVCLFLFVMYLPVLVSRIGCFTLGESNVCVCVCVSLWLCVCVYVCMRVCVFYCVCDSVCMCVCVYACDCGYDCVCTCASTDLRLEEERQEDMTLRWQSGTCSNYDYLLYLNRWNKPLSNPCTPATILWRIVPTHWSSCCSFWVFCLFVHQGTLYCFWCTNITVPGMLHLTQNYCD